MASTPLAIASEPVQFASVMPGLAVSNVARSVEFFSKVLGFAHTFTNSPEGAPVYAIVARDGIEIGLGFDNTGYRVGRGSVYIKLAGGIDTFYEGCVRGGAEIAHELRDETYGMREFMIKDPDGNTVNFGQPILQA